MSRSHDGASRFRVRRAATGDRGAVLVEFAITFPVLVMFLLGMFTGGLAWNQKLAMTNGVREGSRFGATLAVSSSSCGAGGGTLDCWLTQVADVTQSASEGELGSTVATRRICVAYVYPAGTATTPNDRTKSLVRTSSGDSITTGSTCFATSDGRPDTEHRVQVTASRQATLEFMLFTLTPTLSTESVTKFEAET
jgi:Flp pilus assembly protein TadG